jgi:hypothetical protein
VAEGALLVAWGRLRWAELGVDGKSDVLAPWTLSSTTWSHTQTAGCGGCSSAWPGRRATVTPEEVVAGAKDPAATVGFQIVFAAVAEIRRLHLPVADRPQDGMNLPCMCRVCRSPEPELEQ